MRWPGVIALLVLTGGAASASPAQIAPPVIQWQRSFGGTNYEEHVRIRQTPDGGYILSASSTSPPSGNKTSEHFGSYDIWLLRLDSAGTKLWERSYGGLGYEFVLEVQVTTDGGFLLAGESNSPTNPVKSGIEFGSGDCWLLRLDTDGNKIWDKTYGGTSTDRASAVIQMSDGGFVVAGESSSRANGNKSSPNFGGPDFWIFRTDADGNLLWDRSFGGNNYDVGLSVCETANGSIVMGGYSWSSTGGNKTSQILGGVDFWLVALNAAGDKLWEQSYGGSSHDIFSRVIPLADGGFVLAGTSSSPPGPNKDSACFGPCSTSSWYDGDFWLLKTDGAGNRVVDQSFGGDSMEIPGDLTVTSDGGFVACGQSSSGVSGNKAAPSFGGGDAWLVRLDSNLNKLWELSLGGTLSDGAQSIRQTSDGGFIVACKSVSGADGNKTTPAIGEGDLWIVKLGPDALTAPQLRTYAQSADAIRMLGFYLELLPPVNAPTNALYILEGSADRTNWEAIQTNLLSAGASGIWFVDESATNRPARIYRARMER